MDRINPCPDSGPTAVATEFLILLAKPRIEGAPYYGEYLFRHAGTDTKYDIPITLVPRLTTRLSLSRPRAESSGWQLDMPDAEGAFVCVVRTQ